MKIIYYTLFIVFVLIMFGCENPTQTTIQYNEKESFEIKASSDQLRNVIYNPVVGDSIFVTGDCEIVDPRTGEFKTLYSTDTNSFLMLSIIDSTHTLSSMTLRVRKNAAYKILIWAKKPDGSKHWTGISFTGRTKFSNGTFGPIRNIKHLEQASGPVLDCGYKTYYAYNYKFQMIGLTDIEPLENNSSDFILAMARWYGKADSTIVYDSLGAHIGHIADNDTTWANYVEEINPNMNIVIQCSFNNFYDIPMIYNPTLNCYEAQIWVMKNSYQEFRIIQTIPWSEKIMGVTITTSAGSTESMNFYDFDDTPGNDPWNLGIVQFNNIGCPRNVALEDTRQATTVIVSPEKK